MAAIADPRETHRTAPRAADRQRSRGRFADLRHRRRFRDGARPPSFSAGCGTVQVCTAAMRYGYRIVEDMIDGLTQWMDEKGLHTIDDFRGASPAEAPPNGNTSTLNYKIVARINRGHLYRLRPLLHRLLGRRPSVHSSRRARDARGHRNRQPGTHRHHAYRQTRTPRKPCQSRHRRCASHVSMKRNAWAAISAGWFAQLRTASRWKR